MLDFRLSLGSVGDNMIVFDLACDNNHPFEGWFGTADDFALQAKAGHIACPVCGSVEVKRQLSAPYVNTRSGSNPGEESQMVAVANAAQELKKKFIAHVLSSTDTVLERRFATARSGLPSPLTSPIATEKGWTPVAKSVLAPNPPAPLPSSTDTVLEL